MIQNIKTKAAKGERITKQEAITLYSQMPLFELLHLAYNIKISKSGKSVFYNQTFHLEPTNICKFNCIFCSYRKDSSLSGGWDMSPEEITSHIKSHYHKGITEIHLVGGVNREHTFEHYKNIISLVRSLLPNEVKIKAFSAVEHIEMIHKEGISYQEGIKQLLASGMDSITGGGAEIFDSEVRRQICSQKADAKQWLEFHRECHRQGIKTNSTMLYGHIESLENRNDHLLALRDLQDEYAGFLSFIPLKFRSRNNSMESLGECSVIEDLRTLAISRIVLDNFPHIKAYWPMYGKSTTQLALLAGADDVDGTVKNTTKIYSMAGVDDNALHQDELEQMIRQAGFEPVERDTFYNPI